MSVQTSPRIPFRPAQCPTCAHYVEVGHRCRGYTDESWPRPLLAVLRGDTTEPCPRHERVTQAEAPTEVSPGAAEQGEAPAEPVPGGPEEGRPAAAPVRGEARIHCPRCRAANPPDAERCQDCDAKLLPAEGAGQRLAYLLGGIGGAAMLGLLFYQFYVRNPGSAPDIPICNVGALGGGAVVCLVMGVVLALRKTPAYMKYKNRAERHVGLNPWQALADLGRAMELAPEKEQGNLLKKRAEVYGKLGRTEDAARDHLVLATSTGAFKGEGEFVAALTGADAGVYSHGRRSAQITALLTSGKARAVGYCPKCKAAVELDAEQRCRVHPKAKGREVQYVIPTDVLSGKLAVLQKLESGNANLAAQVTGLLESGQAKAVGYCPRCRAAVELDARRRCPTHPKVKGRGVQYVVRGDVARAKRAVLQQRREEKRAGRRRTVVIVDLIVLAVALLVLVYDKQIGDLAEKLMGLLR